MNEIINLSEETVILARKQFLNLTGGINKNLYFIESGSLRIFVMNDDQEQIVRLGYEGNFIVALDSFLTGKPSEFLIQAIKRTVLKVITKQQIDEFLKDESNQKLWTEILENIIIQKMERDVDLLTNSPSERYERVLKRSPQLFQKIPNKHIANYLRMSPETLWRLKKS